MCLYFGLRVFTAVTGVFLHLQALCDIHLLIRMCTHVEVLLTESRVACTSISFPIVAFCIYHYCESSCYSFNPPSASITTSSPLLRLLVTRRLLIVEYSRMVSTTELP